MKRARQIYFLGSYDITKYDGYNLTDEMIDNCQENPDWYRVMAIFGLLNQKQWKNQAKESTILS